MTKPKYAILAITLNCNSRCIMCNIWQNHIKNELEPEYFLKLPPSLTDINITGGEPFLRKDIAEIVRNMKTACPNARLVINTNGFMPHKIGPDVREILKTDPKFALRVSIDGMGEAHDKIRRIPGGFDKIMRTVDAVRSSGIKDLGVSFTLGNYNTEELPKVQDYCKKEQLEFSLTVVTGSVIYFGKDKASYRPTDKSQLAPLLRESADKHLASFTPKELIRSWFVRRMYDYLVTGKRALACDAGDDFFYMDSTGNIYTCHLKPWKMGNIKDSTFGEIFKNNKFSQQVKMCNDCWMICTAKSMIRKNLPQVLSGVASDLVKQAVS